jgi:hypothetical protein
MLCDFIEPVGDAPFSTEPFDMLKAFPQCPGNCLGFALAGEVAKSDASFSASGFCMFNAMDVQCGMSLFHFAAAFCCAIS